MKVTLIRAWPRMFEEIAVEVAETASVGDALDTSVWAGHVGEMAVFGTRAARETPLHDGDRIELLRPLVADPKQARRARAASRKP